jgi:DNA (cytosine-5)-methyltransferase 1
MNVLHLCAGIDGFGLALDATPTWVADNDPDAAAVLAHHYPNTPNLGDVWSADWAALGTVDVLCAGYPCQPFSTAGQRKGTEDERHLWPAIRDAIAHTRPGLVLLENVRGHLSLGFDIVLGDLADLRFDAEWAVFTSAEIGAPHRRERLYIAATPNPAGVGRDGRAWAGLRRSGRVEPAVDRRGHLTPLLPTPTATMAPQMRGERSGSWQPPPNLVDIAESGHDLTDSIWWPAVQRWATVTGTTPPPFVHVGPKGGRTVDARFVEWMMGYRAGWVTDLGLSNSRALKLLGNSVQPQTARLAIGELTQRLAVA